jgi:ATP-dependent DNA ligase
VLVSKYEGMVAKDPDSSYTPGRTLSWLKVKQKGYRQEARGFH